MAETPELFYKVVGSIFLEEHETAALMRDSGGKPLACDFGPGWVRLKLPASAWAVPLLANMRGLKANPVNGILVYGAHEE